MAIDAGTKVGRFRVIKLVAQGGMAEVYRAEQELTTGIYRPAALKVIRPEYAESEDFREMFLDEARTACTLSHPNIVHIYEVGESDGLLYMGMELVSGETLNAVTRAMEARGQKFDDDSILAIGIYTCSALEAVHALKVSGAQIPGEQTVNLVHRDVSPQNLLLSPNGALRLIDFGIAKAATNRNLTMPGMTKGKAGYFSPEQAIGQPLDGRSDLFSLGVMLYRLAAGVTPFEEHKSHQERQTALVTGKWRPLSEVAPTRLAGLHRVVAKSMQLLRENRYQSATEMREDLEAVAYEAGTQIGQASLAGWVAEHDGEISIPDARKVSGPHLVRRRTFDQMPAQSTSTGIVAPVKKSPQRRALAAGIWATVMAAGVAVFVLQSKRAAEPKPPAAQVVAAPSPAEPSVAAEAPPPAPAAEGEATGEEPKQVMELAPIPMNSARPHAASGPARARAAGGSVAVNASARAAARTAAPPKAAPEPEVFTGSGRLRIGSNDGPGNQVASFIAVAGGAKMGETPLDVKAMKSGKYTLEFSSAELGKRGQCVDVKVTNEKTTRVIYDYKTGQCVIE